MNGIKGSKKKVPGVHASTKAAKTSNLIILRTDFKKSIYIFPHLHKLEIPSLSKAHCLQNDNFSGRQFCFILSDNDCLFLKHWYLVGFKELYNIC